MLEERSYIPKKGDIVWIDFDLSAGKEIQKRRLGLVVSRYEFNRKTMFAVICPITSTIKNLPTRYSLPEDLDINGQVIISQLKSLDFKERKLKKIENLPLKDTAKIDQIIEYIFWSDWEKYIFNLIVILIISSFLLRIPSFFNFYLSLNDLGLLAFSVL